MTEQKLISMTGDRPTGPLHLGHLCGITSKKGRITRSGEAIYYDC